LVNKHIYYTDYEYDEQHNNVPQHIIKCTRYSLTVTLQNDLTQLIQIKMYAEPIHSFTSSYNMCYK